MEHLNGIKVLKKRKIVIFLVKVIDRGKDKKSQVQINIK